MRYPRVAGVLIGLPLATTAWASDPPRPRPPLGPTTESNAMLPTATDPLSEGETGLPKDRTRVFNIGNQSLNVAYWDGDQWERKLIGSRSYLDATCSKCAGEIPVVFHNGREVTRVPTSTGRVYLLFWDSKDSVWALKLPPPK
jgi:hypothetical protein